MKLRIYFAIGLVFLLGMVSGGLLAVQVVKSTMRSLTSSSTPELSRRVLERLDQELGLSGEQREAISAILADAVEEVGPLRTEFRAKARAVVQNYQSRIGSELNAKQQKELEQMVGGLFENWNLEAKVE